MSKFEKLLTELNETHNGAGFTFCTNEEKNTLTAYAITEEKENLLPLTWQEEIEENGLTIEVRQEIASILELEIELDTNDETSCVAHNEWHAKFHKQIHVYWDEELFTVIHIGNIDYMLEQYKLARNAN